MVAPIRNTYESFQQLEGYMCVYIYIQIGLGYRMRRVEPSQNSVWFPSGLKTAAALEVLLKLLWPWSVTHLWSRLWQGAFFFVFEYYIYVMLCYVTYNYMAIIHRLILCCIIISYLMFSCRIASCTMHCYTERHYTRLYYTRLDYTYLIQTRHWTPNPEAPPEFRVQSF